MNQKKPIIDYEREKWLHRQWETDHKIYFATLKKDLFGDWIIVKHWSSKSKRGGQEATTPVGTYQSGIDHLTLIHHKRISRGYFEVKQKMGRTDA